MNPDSHSAAAVDDREAVGREPPAPPAVMCFNASEPSGAGGVAGDVATAAAMGAHALPIVTSIVMRDTADIFDQHDIDADVVVEQARTILEDITIAAWKVGFLGSADNVSAVAEVLSDYTDIPLVTHLPNLGWMDEDRLQPYLDAFRELILPATEVLGPSTARAMCSSPAWRWPPRAPSSTSTTCWPRRKVPWPARSSSASRPASSVPVTRSALRWRRCWPPGRSCSRPCRRR
jgi:hypothetical protein